MNNNRGSVLIITLAFILVFTLLGFSSIYLGTVHSELADVRQSSEEAFWLADGAIEVARSKLPTLIPESNPPVSVDGAHSYDVFSVRANCGGGVLCNHKWDVESEGITNKATGNNQKRAIEAVLSRYAIDKPFYTRGVVNTPGVGNSEYWCGDPPTQSPEACKEENSVITFETVFGGVSYSDVRNLTTPIQYTVTSPDITPANITVVDVLTGNTIKVNQNSPSTISFLVLDFTNSNVSNPKLSIQGGNNFWGIIWIIGKPGSSQPIEIQSNTIVNGAVFVAGSGSDAARVNGGAQFVFDAQVIEAVIDNLTGGGAIPEIKVVSWKEI